MPGRPTVKRKRSRSEVGGDGAGTSTVKRRKCLNCYQYGHNRRSCTNAPFTVTPLPTVPIPRGRPRVDDQSRSSSRSHSVNRGGGNARGRGVRGKFVPKRGGGIRTRSQVSFDDSVKGGGPSDGSAVGDNVQGPGEPENVQGRVEHENVQGTSEGDNVGENVGGPNVGGPSEVDDLLAEIDDQLQPRSVRHKPATKSAIAPRKKSERILLKKLGNNVVTKDGKGSVAENPVEMD